MWGKMQVASFKICTFIISNLAKISLEQLKKIREKVNHEQKIIIDGKILEIILDAMLGPEFSNKDVKEKKMNDIKKGRYNDLPITLPYH